MEDPSEGDQINDQTIRPSAAEKKKLQNMTKDQRYHLKRKQRLEAAERELEMMKKQKIEATERDLEMIKKKYTELEENHNILKGRLQQLEMEQQRYRETIRELRQRVEDQAIRITMFQQFTGNGGELPVPAYENQVLQADDYMLGTGNSGELPGPADVYAGDDSNFYGEIPAMQQQ